MPCKGCERRKAKLKALADRLLGRTGPQPHRWSITCPCGLERCMPEGIKVGDSFSLVACPKCGQTFVGTFLGSQVERLDG